MWRYQSTDTERLCLGCDQVLPITAFQSRERKGQGVYHSRRCEPCAKARRRQLYQLRIEAERGGTPAPWIYRSTDTKRPCLKCKQVLPIDRFGTRWERRHGRNNLYHFRTCKKCVNTRPAQMQRRNIHGEWRCSMCKKFLHISKFRFAKNKGRPYGYCRECYNTYQRLRWRKLSTNDDWYERNLAQSNKRARERRHEARRHRDQMARDAYRWLTDHGWRTTDLMRECHLAHATIIKLQDESTPILHPSVMDKLVALWKREMGLEEIAA